MASSPRIEELRKKFEDNPRRYFAPLANEFRKAGDLEQAIALCRTHLRDQPTHMSGHIVFGQALFESGEHEEARQIFEAALALDPENLIALRHLGDIARLHGDANAARGWYQRVLEADPRNDEIAGLLRDLPQDSPAPVAATTSALGSTDLSGWGEINPERSDEPAPLESLASAVAEAPELPTWSPAPPASQADERTSVMDRASIMAAMPASVPPQDDLLDLDEREFSVDMGQPASTAAPMPELEREEEFVASGMEAHERLAEPHVEVDLTGVTSEEAREEAELPEWSAEEPAPTEEVFQSTAADARTVEFIAPPAEHDAVEIDAAAEAGVVDEAIDELGRTPEPTPAAFVTETMAELYLQQGFRDEALDVYRQLLAQSPDDAALLDRIRHLESGERASASVAEISESVIEAAEQRQAASAVSRQMRIFFGLLASRRAPVRDPADQSYGDGASASSESDNGEFGTTVDQDASAAATSDMAPHDAGVESTATATVPQTESEPYSPDAYDPLLDGFTEEFASAAPSVETPVETYASPGTPPDEHGPSAESGTGGSVDSLFSGAPVGAQDEARATALASVFSQPPPKLAAEISGRPTRAASTELSLDNVFREPQSRPEVRRESGSFSFDQFFAAGATGATPAAGPTGTTGGARAANRAPAPKAGEETRDIEQFTAWLEGLKKT